MQKKGYKNMKYEEQAAIVQLIGDMKQNVQQLIQSINCRCGIESHLRTILTIYCNKIQKLRTQRNLYKSKCQQLDSQISQIRSNPYVDVQPTTIGFESGGFCGKTSASVRSGKTQSSNKQQNEQNDNIFQTLNKQLQLPVSMTFRQNNQNCSNTDSYLIPSDNVIIMNPQDSLLLTQSSCDRIQLQQVVFNQQQQKQPCKEPMKINIKSFQQFLQEKVEGNHMKLKIREDLNSLVYKKNRRNSPERRPLRDKFAQLYN